MAAPFLNQLDDNTLAAQYDQIRKTQGSGSARSLREAFRQGGFGDETQQDLSSGIRRAGWKDTTVAPESMPEVDTESKNLLGNRIGEYTTGAGSKQFGYYGDVDVYNRQQLDPWLNKSGFSYAKGPEDADYVKAGLDLPSLWKNPLFKTGEYDWTQKFGYNNGSGVYNKGVNDYMSSLGFTQDLGNKFDLQATTQLPGLGDNFTKVKDYYGKKSINDYLASLGYNDITDSRWKDYIPFVEGQNSALTGGREWWSGNANMFNQTAGQSLSGNLENEYLSRYSPTQTQYYKNMGEIPDEFFDVDYGGGWGSEGGSGGRSLNTQRLTDAGYRLNNDTVEKLVNGYTFNGQTYDTREDAVAAQQSHLGRLRGLTKTQQAEALEGILGGTGPGSFDDRGNFIGNNKQLNITGNDITKFGTLGDIYYNNNKLGTILDRTGFDPFENNWDEQSSRTWRAGLNKKTETNVDQGYSNILGPRLADLGSGKENLRSLGDGNVFAKDLSGIGLTSPDEYYRYKDSQTTKKFSPPGHNLVKFTHKYTDPLSYKLWGGDQFYDNLKNNGLLSAGFQSLDPWLDKIDPIGHDRGQNLAMKLLGKDSQEETFKTIAGPVATVVGTAFGMPWLGGALTAADSASRGDFKNAAVAGAGALVGANGLGNLGSYISSGLNVSPAVANSILSSVVQGAGQGMVNKEGIAGILKRAGIGGLASYVGGAGGDLAGKSVANLVGGGAGNIAGSVARGAVGSLGSGAVRRLGGGNQSTRDMMTSAGLAALTGGIGAGTGELSKVFGSDALQAKQYGQIASNIANLGVKGYQGNESKQKQEAAMERQQLIQNSKLAQLQRQLQNRQKQMRA